jgi:putative transposase
LGISADRRRASRPRRQRLGDVGPLDPRGGGCAAGAAARRLSWRQFLRPQAAATVACDFLTVETLSLKRIYILFFISLERRRIELLASTSAPDGAWVTQQAHNLLMALDGQQQPFRVLIHDRDRKFSRSFDEVFRSEAIDVIKTPVQAPNANACAERLVRTLRSDCLDRCLILSGRHLDHLLRVYREHYNGHRPHRSLALHPPHASRPLAPARASPNVAVCRRDLLGGLIHEYESPHDAKNDRDRISAPYESRHTTSKTSLARSMVKSTS